MKNYFLLILILISFSSCKKKSRAENETKIEKTDSLMIGEFIYTSSGKFYPDSLNSNKNKVEKTRKSDSKNLNIKSQKKRELSIKVSIEDIRFRNLKFKGNKSKMIELMGVPDSIIVLTPIKQE